MSFANNCFGLCNTCLHCFHRRSFLRQRIVVSHKYIGKTFLSKNLSQYNYLFRFCFLYSVFNDHLPALMGLAVASFKQLRLRSRHRILCESPPEFGRRHCRLVGSSGLEPPTSRLSGARSNQLSYEPIDRLYSVVLSHSLFSSQKIPVRVFSVWSGDDGIRSRRELRALVARGRNSPPDCSSVPLVLRIPSDQGTERLLFRNLSVPWWR